MPPPPLPPGSPLDPGCFVIAAPQEVDVPARLSGAIAPHNPHWYIGQLPNESLLSETAKDSESLVEQIFSEVATPNPWPEEFPPLHLQPPTVLAMTPTFGTQVTRVEVVVHKVKVIAIIDSGSPVNFISSKLSQRIKMAPDVAYNVTYGTAGMNSVQALGAYSALPL